MRNCNFAVIIFCRRQRNYGVENRLWDWASFRHNCTENDFDLKNSLILWFMNLVFDTIFVKKGNSLGNGIKTVYDIDSCRRSISPISALPKNWAFACLKLQYRFSGFGLCVV